MESRMIDFMLVRVCIYMQKSAYTYVYIDVCVCASVYIFQNIFFMYSVHVSIACLLPIHKDFYLRSEI